jgi:signal transduction histidine kinase/CheY-like chemotaxis protein
MLDPRAPAAQQRPEIHVAFAEAGSRSCACSLNPSALAVTVSTVSLWTRSESQVGIGFLTARAGAWLGIVSARAKVVVPDALIIQTSRALAHILLPQRRDFGLGSSRKISTQDRVLDTGPARLIAIAGSQAGRKFKIGDLAVIGRAGDAAVTLEDPEVSRNHARISKSELGAYLLEDLGSKNGTQVNGLPITRHLLSFGDKIQIGPHVMLLFAPFDPVEDQLLQRQRLEALGRVGAGVAHDLNNMLGAIGASVDYLAGLPEGRTLSSEEVRECFADIRLAAGQASELTRSILKFARGRAQAHSPVDLSGLCSDVMRLIRHTFDRAIQIDARIHPGLSVRGDQAELHQVLMNLCLNARDAMPRGGVLSVSASAVTPGSHALPKDLNTTLHYLALCVEDTGTGMDEATRARVFEPFFTTKREGAGFGLGLATVKEVVAFHGGQIQIESTEGKGTRFLVFLPLYRALRETNKITAEHEVRPASSRGLILLVDDEEVVRRSFARLLRQAGHQVVEAPDGVRAIDLYTGAIPRPNLVILDLDMPILTGEETQERLLAVDPAARILFVSGHDEPTRESAVHARGALGFLRKPCQAQVLLGAVSEALGPSWGHGEHEERTRPT